MIWSTLRHPNVLPLLGVTLSENRFVMISEWMDNGNVNEFLEKNPYVDRLELVGILTGSLSLLVPNSSITDVAQRHHQRVGLHARSRSSSRGPQGSTCLVSTPCAPRIYLRNQRPTS